MPRETNENNQIEECFGTDSEYDSESVILPIKIDRSSATPINLLIKPKHDQAPSTIMFVSPEPTPETKEQQSTSTYSSLLNKVCRKFSSLTTFTSTSKSSDFPPTPVSPIRMPDFNEPQQAFGNFTAINDPPPRKSKMSRTRSVPTETVETSLVKRRRRRAKGKSYSVNACFEIMRIEPPKDPVLPGTRALFDDSFPMPAGRRAPAEMLFELP
jgi:hypothetical protein